MIDSSFRLDYVACRDLLTRRLDEPAPARIQLLAGPRQVGKTTLLLDLAKRHEGRAIYAAADAPEAALPGFWDRTWARTEQVARARGRAVLLLDEVHLLPDWSARLKSEWDRLRRRRLAIQVVATGSSALRLDSGSRETLAGRFERLILGHWTASSLAQAFRIPERTAVQVLVRQGGYPGAMPLRKDAARWSAYVREAILEPALGRDIQALGVLRKPALLRQVFGVAAASPAQIVSLQKMQGQLLDRGALETIAHYLQLLEQAFLVAALDKFAARPARRRSAPPKLVTLSNALLAVTDPAGIPDPAGDPRRFGAWVENACLAHAWGAGQRVSYWREEPLEVDAMLEGSWGRWALEITVGAVTREALRGILEVTRRNPDFRPLVLCEPSGLPAVERAGIQAMDWREFLLRGPPA